MIKSAVLRAGMCALAFCVGGCGDFFSVKPTELQTDVILAELRQIRENPHVGNPLPDIYLAPPQIIEVNGQTKLFYFARNNTVSVLSNIVRNQLGLKIDSSAPTNQLVINCDSRSMAEDVLEFLMAVDVPPIQVNIDCIIIERFGDITMDWETTILVENFLGESITLGQSKSGPAFPGAALREPKRREFGLDFGYWRNRDIDGKQFRAMIDVLVSRGYLKILMNPSLETVNGQTAKISSRDNVPLDKVVSSPDRGELPYNVTEYQWVEDSLEVTPHVYADGSIGLETTIKFGSRSKPEGVIQVPIITERQVTVRENRIPPGGSLVIGGLRKSEEKAVVRGVPFFKDLPVVGPLFSSKDFEEKSNEVIFILTPSISSGGVEYEKMAEHVRRRMARPTVDQNLHQTIMDPLRSSAYIDAIERKAAEAERYRVRAEREAAQAEREIAAIRAELEHLEVRIRTETAENLAQLQAERAKAARALEDAQKAKAAADKAISDAAASAAAVEKARAQAGDSEKKLMEATAEAERANREAEKARIEAEKAHEAARKALEEARKAVETREDAAEQP